jgi:integrase
MRPGEVVQMRTCDVDRSDDVWLYRPPSHKTQHLNKVRVIALGPRAQDALASWLRAAEPEAPLFQPVEAEAARRATLEAERKARGGVGNHKRPARRPKRRTGKEYSVASYRRAIERGCKKAGVGRWTPHRLRHSFATRARREFGLDAARAALGHSGAEVTLDYAELDTKAAAKVAGSMG